MNATFADDVKQVIELAEDTFGNSEKALHWLKSPNRAMEGQKPIDLLNSAQGREMVRTILGRIDWGLFS